MKHEITSDDILPMEEYGATRRERRRQMSDLKRQRRVSVGPHATFYFESFETMLHQIHEMLYIERGGDEQIPGELEAYNPLIPKGKELVATVMIEIDDPLQRARTLAGLGGFEETTTLSFDGETVTGVPAPDMDRTTADGKASSVQFIHFPFTDVQIEKFRTPGTRVVIGFNHKNYGHMAVMQEETRAALAGDFN